MTFAHIKTPCINRNTIIEKKNKYIFAINWHRLGFFFVSFVIFIHVNYSEILEWLCSIAIFIVLIMCDRNRILHTIYLDWLKMCDNIQFYYYDSFIVLFIEWILWLELKFLFNDCWFSRYCFRMVRLTTKLFHFCLFCLRFLLSVLGSHIYDISYVVTIIKLINPVYSKSARFQLCFFFLPCAMFFLSISNVSNYTF